MRNITNINTDTIYVYINSQGGSVDAGNLLINQLNYQKALNKTVECIAQKAYSMAFHLLQTCDKRFITPSSKVMQHQISLGGIDGPLENLLHYVDMIKNISNSMDTFTAKRINLSYNEYIAKVNNDWWLFGEDIITNNVADEMVYVGCDAELYASSYVKEEVELGISSSGNFAFVTKNSTYDLCPI